MDLHSFTPSDLTENLTCFVCNSYLSYFPISLCSNNQSLCGRCTVPEGMISFQNEALEMICLYLNFPCRFNTEGCLEELSPEDVPEHEKTCPFRTVRCIVNKSITCGWSGSLPTLLQHCQNTHPESFVAVGSEFELDLSSCNERDYVMEHGDSFVIFTKKYECETKLLEFAVHNSEYVHVLEGGACQLKIMCGGTTILHDFEVSTFEEKIFSSVCLPFIRDDNDESLSLAKITIGERDVQNRSSIQQRSGLICVYCSNYALPPIYRRTADMAVICYSCGGAGRRCSHCTTPKRVRDFVLEQFAMNENYPCIYQQNGCRYISTPTGIIRHQTTCCYETIHCPIVNTCKWVGASKDTEDHFVRVHPKCIMGVGEKVEFSLKGVDAHRGVLKLGQQLFMMVYFVEKNNVVWVIQPLGQCAEKFKYEVNIFDVEDEGFLASMRQVCSKWINAELISKVGESVCFGVEQVLRQSDEAGSKEAIKFSVQIFRC